MICEGRAPVFESVFKNSRMQPSGGHQQQPKEYDYDYSNQYSQQGDRPAVPSMRPTLEAPVYYQPSPLPQQYTPQQQTYYQPSRTPVAISQFPYAESPMEHKPIAAYQQQSDYRMQATPEARAEPAMPMERMCDVCQYPDPVLVAPNCNHIFHSRCVHVWPLDACPACVAPLDQVAISPTINMMVRPEPRSGKWTRPEEKFIDGILCEFDRQALPLAHGTPIRLVLAKMLNCSTMRLSKKFQKNALGKRTFRVTKPGKGEKALQFDQMDHARRQRELSRLEQIFRQELVDQFRRENNTDEGALVETQNLCLAVQQFWVSNFLKFAVLIGQPVMGLDVSDAKKRKRAMQLLRNGQFNELLSWNHHPSPANSASVTPMPPLLASTSADSSAVTASWSSGAATVYSSSMHESGPSIPALLQQPEQRPVKKMRTPEAHVEVNRFGLQPPPMDQSQYPQYGRLSPPASSATSFDYSQQQQQQQPAQQYQPEPFLRPSSFSPYSDGKAEKSGMGYANVLQHQQQQQMLPGIAAHEDEQQRSGFAPAGYPRAGEAYHGSGAGQAAAPWDDLLENMSSEANTGAAPTSQPQGGDSGIQNWNNMSMM